METAFGGFSQSLSQEGGSDPHPTSPKSRQKPTGEAIFYGIFWVRAGDVTIAHTAQQGGYAEKYTEFSTELPTGRESE